MLLWTMHGSMKAWQCLLPSLQDFYCNAYNTGQAGRTRRPLCSSASTASSLACNKGCSMGSMLRRTLLYIVHSASRLLICARSVSARSCSCNEAAHQRRFCQREVSLSCIPGLHYSAQVGMHSLYIKSQGAGGFPGNLPSGQQEEC